MCKAVEFKDLKFRSGEKAEYDQWNKRDEMQWPIRKVTDSSDKVNILIQVDRGPLGNGVQTKTNASYS